MLTSFNCRLDYVDASEDCISEIFWGAASRPGRPRGTGAAPGRERPCDGVQIADRSRGPILERLQEATCDHTRLVLFAHRPLTKMDKADRIRAVYLHACLRYVNREHMTNTSVRERFGIELKNICNCVRIKQKRRAKVLSNKVLELSSFQHNALSAVIIPYGKRKIPEYLTIKNL